MPTDEHSSTLYFGPWYRKSPFFEATRRAGCSAYDIYNHMYLPGYYDDPVKEYWHLLEHVTLWDVGVERVVEITGPDALSFTNLLTCRDLTRCAPGQGKYAPVIAPHGGIVNDPVLLRLNEDRFWLCLADSDAGLYARGIAWRSGMDVEVDEPDVYPVQVQGKQAKDLVADLFDEKVTGLRYYWCAESELEGIPVVVSRTGWTGEIGYEVYLRDPSRGDDLWNLLMEAGRKYEIRPVAPVEARRVEAGIFNYGSDMTIEHTPFELMGMERLVEEQDADYIGKDVLERQRRDGVERKLVGVEMPGEAIEGEFPEHRPAFHDGRAIGPVTEMVWSPRLETNIGYVWVPMDLAEPGTEIEVDALDRGRVPARTAAIPFVDPRKEIPAA
jgi:glycine cleavage system aminomethyltransferase T